MNATRLISDKSKSSDAPVGPLSCYLRFYLAACSVRKFIKKITHFYPFHFLLPCYSALRLPRPAILDAGAHSPCCCRLPHTPCAAARSRPVARWCWWCSLCPSHAPPARPTQARRWCSYAHLVLDANGALVPPLAASSHADDRNWLAQALPVFQTF
jgi:hypothetical protein